jgi:glycine cleavage system regulatory protein
METLVLTVIGEDRPGLVELLSRIVVEHGANWEESRMARLANRFAGILLVAVPPRQIERLAAALRALETEGLTIIVAPGGSRAPASRLRAYQLEVVGGDRPGITQKVARVLADRRVNVEDLSSDVVPTPETGGALFQLRAVVHLPDEVEVGDLRRSLEAIAGDLLVDVTLGDAPPRPR